MNPHKRILVELLAPPPLAVLLLLVTGRTSDSFLDIVIGLLPIIGAAYGLGIVPSIIYMGVMEFWFRWGLHTRFGLLCTVLLSGTLGAAAGFLIQLFLASSAGPSTLWWIGALVGLLIGVYVGRFELTIPRRSAGHD